MKDNGRLVCEPLLNAGSYCLFHTVIFTYHPVNVDDAIVVFLDFEQACWPTKRHLKRKCAGYKRNSKKHPNEADQDFFGGFHVTISQVSTMPSGKTDMKYEGKPEKRT